MLATRYRISAHFLPEEGAVPTGLDNADDLAGRRRNGELWY